MSLSSDLAAAVPDRWKRALGSLRPSERIESAQRWLTARRRLIGDIGIWYHADYGAPGLSQSAKVPNVEFDRGGRIVDALELEGLLWGRDVRKGAPIPLSALLRAHTLDYLEAVTEASTLGPIFGLHAGDVDVDTILRAQRRAAGGTLESSRWARARRGRIAFNLGGGFHHAEPEKGGGFCVYNDVAASILTLRRFGFLDRCAIVDLDFHQGNGNLAAFAEDESVLTYSLHGAVWSHVKAVSDISVKLPSGTGDAEYLDTVRRTLLPALRDFEPSLIFYIAGTDVLAGDALGDFQLSEDGVFARDSLVLQLGRDIEASTVVTLAGGYSPAAWRSTARMMRWALTDSTASLPVQDEGQIRKLFGRIASGLDPYELQFDDDAFQLTDKDLMGELEGAPAANRVLGYYSVHGVELAFERYGLLETLRNRGFRDLRFQVDPRDPDRQRVSIYGTRDLSTYHLLVELLVSRRRVPLPTSMDVGGEPLDMLSIEWLLLQDPTRTFAGSQSPLPGQEHPGLGLLRELMEMLYQACLRLGLDGIVMHPSRFHIAAVAAGQCVFLDPAIEGRFEALTQALEIRDLARVSGLIERGLVVRDDGTAFEWQPEDFVAPVSARLRDYLSSKAYTERRDRARDEAAAAGIALHLVDDEPG